MSLTHSKAIVNIQFKPIKHFRVTRHFVFIPSQFAEFYFDLPLRRHRMRLYLERFVSQPIFTS
jgi:hypothetical protein